MGYKLRKGLLEISLNLVEPWVSNHGYAIGCMPVVCDTVVKQ